MNIVVQPQTVTVKANPQSQTVSIEAQSASIDVQENILTVAFSEPIAREIVGGEPYTGDYDVIPLANSAVVLPTSARLMLDDVTVRKIPYYETSNLSGGKTAYIASEVVINGN